MDEGKSNETVMAFVKAIQTMDLDSNREVETFVDDDKMIANGAAPVSVLTKLHVWGDIADSVDDLKSGVDELLSTIKYLKQKSPYPLHEPRSAEELLHDLKEGADANGRQKNGDAPIHSIVKRRAKNSKERRERFDLLFTLLSHSNADVNAKTEGDMTALHFTVQDGSLDCVRILLAFGADLNPVTIWKRTPLDLVKYITDVDSSTDCIALPEEEKWLSACFVSKDGHLKIKCLLECVGALSGKEVEARIPCPTLPLFSADESLLTEIPMQYKNFTEKFRHEACQEKNTSQAIEFSKLSRKLMMCTKGGSRILFLDGGGIRGLIEIEILRQLEEDTGRKIIDIFDWIVATSTGAVITLFIVYGGKSMSECRQLLFQVKDKVFGKQYGIPKKSKALQKMFEREFKELTMDSVRKPKILISAVEKKTINLKVVFYNNCFDNPDQPHLCTEKVWKVARMTSAAPTFFTEFEDHVDGGVLANNPCEHGISAIQHYYRQHSMKIPISLVVSLGTGKFPDYKLGSTDALLFGAHLFNVQSLHDRVENFATLLSNAIAESEVAATICQSRCIEQGIFYYRFNPQLEEVVSTSETDSDKLINMVLQARIQTPKQGMFELVPLLHNISEWSRRVKQHFM